jgi:hypothetical protein
VRTAYTPRTSLQLLRPCFSARPRAASRPAHLRVRPQRPARCASPCCTPLRGSAPTRPDRALATRRSGRSPFFRTRRESATLQYLACACASYCGRAVCSTRPPSISGTPSSHASLTARPGNSSACRRPRPGPHAPLRHLATGRAPLRHLGLPAPEFLRCSIEWPSSSVPSTLDARVHCTLKGRDVA